LNFKFGDKMSELNEQEKSSVKNECCGGGCGGGAEYEPTIADLAALIVGTIKPLNETIHRREQQIAELGHSFGELKSILIGVLVRTGSITLIAEEDGEVIKNHDLKIECTADGSGLTVWAAPVDNEPKPEQAE
jgi:hypothetical protein